MAKKKKFKFVRGFFFESPSPADYAKMLINTKNPNENKELVPEIEHRISDLKDRIKKWVKQKKKNADETLKIFEETLDYNERPRKIFPLASMENQNQNLKKALQEEYIKEENTLIKLKEKKKHKQWIT